LEEELMQYLWKLEKAFMNELLESYPDPRPASTTIATLLNPHFSQIILIVFIILLINSELYKKIVLS